jgi:hypothetical protein
MSGNDFISIFDDYIHVTLIGDGDDECGEVVLDGSAISRSWGGGLFGVSSRSCNLPCTSLTLQGLTISKFPGFPSYRSDPPAGPISLGDGGSLIVKSCKIISCTSEGLGGAITASYNSTLTITNTTFYNNTAGPSWGGGGGAIWSDGSCSISIASSRFESNVVGQDSHFGGGAICTDTEGGGTGGAISLVNCVFSDNTYKGGYDGHGTGGGAIYNGGAASALQLVGCQFEVPANTSAGNNDLFGGATFACPPGTKGTPVTVAGGTVTQLPPSAEIVRCA